jgi:hypothetical protein
MRESISSSFRLILCGLIVLGLSAAALAQFRAGIQGTVTDNNGGVVPEATVTLLNIDTNQTQTTTASESGFYRFSGLAPGNYRVTTEKTGFKKKVLDNVVVNAEQLQGLDITLDAGVISETVTVTADATPLQTEDANIRKSITTQEVLALPQAGRDPYELARLAPGVFGTGARSAGGDSIRFPNAQGPGGSNLGIFATENVQPISANGQRASANNYQIDGTSVNSQTWGGGAVITPSQESVKEVIVTSTTYSAEDGRNSGAQVKVVSQSGTNQWHGSAFFKLNSPSLNAFNTMPRFIGSIDTGGPRRVEREYKSFGGSFGGRIIKDKLFFFFTYEGLREDTSNTYQTLIDTSAFRSTIIAARPNTLIAKVLSTPGIEPRVAQILTPTCAGIFVTCNIVGNGMDVGSPGGVYGQYLDSFNSRDAQGNIIGAPTVGGGLDGIADFQWALLFNPRTFRGNQYNTRIDFQATENDKFTFSSYIVPNTAVAANTDHQSRPQADVNSQRLSYAFGIIYNRTLSATMINEARFNITRWGYDEVDSNPDANLGLPMLRIEGFAGPQPRFGFPRSINTPGDIDERQFDFRDTLTNVIGNHVLKIGGEYRRDVNSNSEIGGARPEYSFYRWNFANGTPIFEGVVADLQGKPTANDTKFTTSELAFFVQDDWKFRPNLTLNLGLRWSYYSPITATDGVLGNLQLGADGLASAKIVTNKELYNKDLNNFGPQFGFAWNPNMWANKLVIRGGAGIGYDRLANNVLAAARRNPPNGANYGICCATSAVDNAINGWTQPPFVNGQISFVASSDGTIYGYPANPLLGGGTNPANGLPNKGSVEIWGTEPELETASVYRYSLEGEYELPAKMVGSISYQGSQGRHFVRINRIQIISPTSNPALQNGVYFASGDVNSNYNAMILRLRGRLINQFTFDTNYRWAKSIDTASYEGASGNADQTYPFDQREERGPSDFDVRHSWIGSATWDIPSFDNPWGRQLVSGWQISAIASWNSGFPFYPWVDRCIGGATSSSAGICQIRPSSYNGTQQADNSNENFLRPGGIFGAPGPSIFGLNYSSPLSAVSRPGIGRNVFRGPRYFSLDMSFVKKIRLGNWGFLGENSSVDLRFNFFNILNNLNLTPFNARTGSSRVDAAEFGIATSGLAGRVGEFQVRFSF